MSKRFVIDKYEVNIIGDEITIISKEINHIKALRYKPEDIININEYVVKIKNIKDNTFSGKIIQKAKKRGEPYIKITLIQSYLKSDKMEFVLQKAVELGITKFIPVISKNTIVKLDEKDKLKKYDRFEKIVKEAVMQCGRTDNVEVSNIQNILDVDYSKYSHVILCYENSKNKFHEVINEIKADKKELNIAVIIGPEGGFSENEVENLLTQNNNIQTVLFGERILRAETASIYALSILDYEFNN